MEVDARSRSLLPAGTPLLPDDLMEKSHHKRLLELRVLLLAAARAGDAHGCTLLLSQGADVEWSDAEGLTALHAAARHGHLATVTALTHVQKEAPERRDMVRDMMKKRDRGSETPLHAAVRNGHHAVAAALIKTAAECTRVGSGVFVQLSPRTLSITAGPRPSGSMPTAQSSRGPHKTAGVTSLEQYQVSEKVQRAVAWLLEARNQFGFTALHVAARHGHARTAAVLIAWRADLAAKDRLEGCVYVCVCVFSLSFSLSLSRSLALSHALSLARARLSLCAAAQLCGA